MGKRIVVWGTGVVGKMVIAEIMPHPVRAGGRRGQQSRQGRAATRARSAGSSAAGITATDDLEALSRCGRMRWCTTDRRLRTRTRTSG